MQNENYLIIKNMYGIVMFGKYLAKLGENAHVHNSVFTRLLGAEKMAEHEDNASQILCSL